MNARTDPEARAFQEAYAEILEEAPPAPSWRDLLDEQPAPAIPSMRWHQRPLAVAAASALLVAILIGSLVLLQPFGTSDEAPLVDDPEVTTIEEPPVTTTPAAVETTGPQAPQTTASEPIGAAPLPPPNLGGGWELLFSTGPDDGVTLDGISVTGGRYYLSLVGGDDHYAAVLDPASEPNRLDLPGGVGFVDGGPGVIGWSMDGRLWASVDGLGFEQVGEDTLRGCSGVASGCEGSEIYAVASSPDGTVVALAYDPLVWDTECECYHLNAVALVSSDGFEWTRHPLDLAALLPPAWDGSADIRSPLVHVDGRFVTYGTHYSNDCMCASTTFFASEDGIDWYPVDTGTMFEESYLLGLTVNADGIVAVGGTTIYASPDGLNWTAVQPAGYGYPLGVAAYDGGFVIVTSRDIDDVAIDTAWYSADGTNWTDTSLDLGVEIRSIGIIADGPDLVAHVAFGSNEWGIWHWSE